VVMPSWTSLGIAVTGIVAALGTLVAKTLMKLLSNQLDKAVGSLLERVVGGALARASERSALRQYRRHLRTRLSRISAPFLNHPSPIDKVFVPLTVEPWNASTRAVEAGTVVNLEYILTTGRVMLLGIPGSGKSTVLSMCALEALDATEAVGTRVVPTPVLVELRRVDGGSNLREQVEKQLQRDKFVKPQRWLQRALRDGNALLLFDGLDEVPKDALEAVTDALQDLLIEYPTVPAIITCRSGIYVGQLRKCVDKTVVIGEFDDAAVRLFLDRYPDFTDGEAPRRLWEVLWHNPSMLALARNPLLLTMLCYLYDDQNDRLPLTRAEFYSRVIDLLVRHVRAEGTLSDRSDLVRELLRRVAIENFSDEEAEPGLLGRDMVLTQARTLAGSAGAPVSAEHLVDDLERRSGLLTLATGGERLQFAHLTLQEFCCADGLRDDPSRVMMEYQRDPDRWREVIILWSGIARAQHVEVVLNALFSLNLQVSLACLAEARTGSDLLVEKIVESSLPLLEQESRVLENPNVRIFGSLARRTDRIGQVCFDKLLHLARSASGQSRAAAIMALALTRSTRALDVLGLMRSDEVIIDGLAQMGDIAVPLLVATAKEGSVAAVDALATVGTRSAVAALAGLMCESDPIATRAAWRVAEHVGSDAEKGLECVELVECERDLKEEEWSTVWAPWSSNERVRFHVARAAALMTLGDAAAVPSPPPGSLDARFVLGVLTATPYWRNRVADFPLPSAEVVSPLVAEALARQREIDPMRMRAGLHSGMPAHYWSSSRDADPPPYAYREIYVLRRYDDTEIDRILDVITDRMLNGLDDVPARKLLFTLPRRARNFVMATWLDWPGRLKPEHWLTVAEPISYNFATSRRYLLIVLSCTALGSLAVYRLASGLSWPTGVTGLLPWLGIISVLLGQLTLLKSVIRAPDYQIFREEVSAGVSTFSASLMLAGPFMALPLTGLPEGFEDVEVIVGSFGPVTVVWTLSAWASQFMSLWPIAAIWILFVLLLMSQLRRGRRKDSLAANPYLVL
jgi:hypothetical protein